ncbi:glycosyltransferase family 117 protein [Dinghuibacter silviterrae]|uniref:Putative membrane protein YfcA n=1 Tax=Dinghuibacter silviterrae TaxID=1539049 RepID=A0A4R8DEU4_9BACT|nr:DUF2723 domain-containing protein [Dinghuibacter silviterrae]TDW96093.1 putative membrane protein YfcA [Dinghuibacter silviterrae]
MQFRKANNITGWIVGGIACIVYLMTREATGSFWDCGEFIASASKVQIPHPPGAPLFILMGRICILLSPAHPAMAVNTLSAMGSGLSILFLFWTITHFARKIVPDDTFTILAAGVVGALAYTFTDSFWFSAVEAEVYGMSGFFTALVFWVALKWENRADEPGADRWIVLLFFLVGLSIGVHLLSLLVLPAVVMIYYFRRYPFSWLGMCVAFVTGCVITGVVQIVVIQKTVGWAGDLDIYFVNKLGLPFFSGFATFYFLLALAIAAGLRVAKRRNLGFLRLGLWCLTFLLIGYSTYITTMERSNADPGVDMFNVDNPISLAGYLGRDQYQDFPLLYGQNFTARAHYVNDGDRYAKGEDKYVVIGRKQHAEYAAADKMWLPRVWDADNADFYAEWLGIGKTADGYERAPNQWDNLTWFLTYQLHWMYWRYFAWNFIGRQNDLQGYGNPRDGNWITGFTWIDNLWLGDQNKMPDTARSANKGYNPMYGLPFLLGVLGFFVQFRRGRKDWVINGVFFFFTGLAIILYLNQPGNQPRERDYAYTGSFYAFAVWIGLGVIVVRRFAGRLLKHRAAGAAAILCLAVPILMAARQWDDHDRSHKTLALSMATNYLESCAPNAILFTFGDNDTYPLLFAQEALGIRPDVRVLNTSLLSFDWYIRPLRYKINQSDPIDPIWSAEAVAGDNRDAIYALSYVDRNAPPDTLTDLETMMREVGGDDPAFAAQTRDGETFHTYPSHLITIPVDTALVRQNGTVDPSDSVVSNLFFRIPANAIEKGDAMVLSIIAANHWARPVYFTSIYDAMGFDGYLRQDGLAYRLVPVHNQAVHIATTKDKLLNVFTFGGAERPGVYFDEENRSHLLTLRNAYISLAASLIGAGRPSEARAVLERCDRGTDPTSMPYGFCSRYGNYHNHVSTRFATVAYQAGDLALAAKVDASVRKDCLQQIAYTASLPAWRRRPGSFLWYEGQKAGDIVHLLDSLKTRYIRRDP